MADSSPADGTLKFVNSYTLHKSATFTNFNVFMAVQVYPSITLFVHMTFQMNSGSIALVNGPQLSLAIYMFTLWRHLEAILLKQWKPIKVLRLTIIILQVSVLYNCLSLYFSIVNIISGWVRTVYYCDLGDGKHCLLKGLVNCITDQPHWPWVYVCMYICMHLCMHICMYRWMDE